MYRMLIASHDEEWDPLARKIADGETVATWSVQLEGYQDDMYNGTFEECAKVARKLASDYEAELLGIALLQLDKNGCVTYTHNFVPAEEIEDEG